MIKSQLKRNAGNKLYSIVGWFCYIACTIISAILNIYLLSKLDQSWAWFLLTMSLSLEFGKAYILIRANTYRSLSEYLKNCKFNASKVLTKERVFYGIYVLFAVLSITASLCFSLTITDKTEQGFSLQKQEIVQNLETVEKSQIKYEEALEKFTMLQDNSDTSVKEAKNKLRSAEDFNKQMDEATERLAEKIAAEKEISKNEAYRTTEYRSSKEKSNYDKSKVDLQRAREDYEDIVSGKTLERAKKAYEAAETEFNEKKNLYGSLETLKLSLSMVEKQELEMAGSSKCFILLANTFGIPDKVKQIKFFILLYVSLLVELCIWLSSPDLRLDGGLLYSYRNDLGLSTKKDVDKLLKEIKDTNTRFSTKDEEPKIKIVEKVPERTLKELDNLKEQVELLSREKEETIASLNDVKSKYEDQIEVLKNKLNTFEDNNDLLEARDTEIEDLRKDIDVLNNLVSEKSELAEKLDKELKEVQEDQNEFVDIHNGTVDRMHEQEATIKELEQKLSENNNEEYLKQIRILTEKCNKLEEEKGLEEIKSKEYENDLMDANLNLSKLNDKIRELSENKKNKYTEEDLKEIVKKTAAKSKKEIKSLKDQVTSWEEAYNKLSVENGNLKLANNSLENNNKSLVAKIATAEEDKSVVAKNATTEEPKKALKDIKVGTLEDEAKKILGI